MEERGITLQLWRTKEFQKRLKQSGLALQILFFTGSLAWNLMWDTVTSDVDLKRSAPTQEFDVKVQARSGGR